MDTIREIFAVAGYVVEAVGVLTIIVGFILSSVWFFSRLRGENPLDTYQQFRRDLARSIILGLEFLIAGDIIRTVTVDQTLTGAAVLAVIVMIRVLLNVTLEFEIERRWPWHRAAEERK